MKKYAVLATVLGVSLLSFAGAAYALEISKGKVTLDKIEEYEQCDDWDIGLCQDALHRWVEQHPADAFKAGKMTRKKMNAWLAVPFFSKAFEQKAGDCKDDDVKRSVASAVGLPQDKKEIIAQAKKIGFDLCFAEMKDSLVEATSEPDGRKNVCAELIAKGALSGLRLSRCQSAQ
jgi:hypothetical protein